LLSYLDCGIQAHGFSLLRCEACDGSHVDDPTRGKIERAEAELNRLLTHFPDLAKPQGGVADAAGGEVEAGDVLRARQGPLGRHGGAGGHMKAPEALDGS